MLAVVVVLPTLVAVARRRGTWAAPVPGSVVVALSVTALVLVAVQGYLGGRQTYEHGVGVQDGGQFAQSAAGSAMLQLALASKADPVTAGKQAFSREGLGCARCHGDLAQGQRGPSLAGGRGLEDFRRVHEHGLFPPKIVSDKQYEVIDTYLKTLGPPEGAGRRER